MRRTAWLAMQKKRKAIELLIDKELAESLAMIDRGIEQIRSGEGLSVEEARRRTLASRDS